MGYTVTSVEINDEIDAKVNFINGNTRNIKFPLGTSVAEIKSKLDEIDAAWPTEQDIIDALPVEYQELVGYTKA